MHRQQGGKKQCESGTGTVASAPYLRCKSYCESTIYAGLLWLDLVPGVENGADMGTKQNRNTPEFLRKDGLLSGRALYLYSECGGASDSAPDGKFAVVRAGGARGVFGGPGVKPQARGERALAASGGRLDAARCAGGYDDTCFDAGGSYKRGTGIAGTTKTCPWPDTTRFW